MPYCPACGRHVAPGDDVCAECGGSISAAIAAGRGDGPADGDAPADGRDRRGPRTPRGRRGPRGTDRG